MGGEIGGGEVQSGAVVQIKISRRSNCMRKILNRAIDKVIEITLLQLGDCMLRLRLISKLTRVPLMG